MKLPESEWPINRVCTLQELPQEPKVVMIANTKPKDFLAVRIDISRYWDYTSLVRVTARVLAMFQTDYKSSFRNVARVLEPADVAKAANMWTVQTPVSKSSRGFDICHRRTRREMARYELQSAQSSTSTV